MDPPFNRGFVPTEFLESTDSQEAPGPAMKAAGQAQSTQSQMYGEFLEGARDAGPVRRLSDPRLSHQLLETLSINPPEEHLPAGPRSSVAVRASTTSQQQNFSHVFAHHDRQFQQCMHMRHEQFRALEESAASLSKRIETAKAKSQEIAENMLDINGIIEEERRRWKEKLSEHTNIYRESPASY